MTMNLLDFCDFIFSNLCSIVHTLCTTVVITFIVWLATTVVNALVAIKTLTAKTAEATCISVWNDLIKFKELVIFATDSTFNSLTFRHWDLTEFD